MLDGGLSDVGLAWHCLACRRLLVEYGYFVTWFVDWIWIVVVCDSLRVSMSQPTLYDAFGADLLDIGFQQLFIVRLRCRL